VKFIEQLKANLTFKKSHVCVGLDSQYSKLPEFLKKGRSIAEAIFAFNQKIIDQTHDLAIFYKMNLSFYAGYGSEGLEGLRMTNEYIKANYPEIQVLADCKRSEMGESVKMVAAELFGWLRFDCVMATPWFGFDTIKDYFIDEAKGVVVYAHDSNPSAAEIQDLPLADGRCVYEEVARKVAEDWNVNGNLMAEAGLTYPDQLRRIRLIIGDEMPLLVAGAGAQGGRIKDLAGLFGANGQRLIVNSSRGIIFSSKAVQEDLYFQDVRQNAVKLRDGLRQVASSG
jgi:orotidine-5'-phosphate decarboxylase